MTTHAPDITGTIPSVLSARTSVTAVYVNSGIRYDFSVAELPFLMAPSNEHPYKRATAQFRREQIDVSQEPGEQTLSSWWVRDQDSWHRGAGIIFYDPGRNNLFFPDASSQDTRYRFSDSRCVDVWSKGEARLLHLSEKKVSTSEVTVVYTTSGFVSGAPVLFNNIAGTVTRWTTGGSTNYTPTGGTPSTRVVQAGDTILVGSTNGIMSGAANGNTLSVLWTSSGTALVPFWAKSRIIAAQDNSLYELTLDGGSLSGPLWTHPAADWTWTAVAETPDSILAAGYSGSTSAVYEFILVDTGSTSTPTLSAAIQVLEVPLGEAIHSLACYLGSFVAIGTNHGLRIGIVDTSGKINYGPLLLETTGSVVDITARDRFIYALSKNPEGQPCVIRVDLSANISDLIYAYAWDSTAHLTGDATTIGLLDDCVAIAALASGIWVQSETKYESTGYITSGAIRFATTEPKYFNSVKVRSTIPDVTGTSVRVSSIDESADTNFIISLSASFNDGEDISFGQSTQKFMSVKLELTASNDASATPVVQGWQVKAQPAPQRQRTIQIPLLCFDLEEDRNGTRAGVQNGAWMRLRALEDLESAGAVFTLQDMTTGESFQGRIETVEFVRTTPPAGFESGFGGIIQLTVTKL